MACTVETRQLFCTTADVHFGPVFESDDEGERFRAFCYVSLKTDPRKLSWDALAGVYHLWCERAQLEVALKQAAHGLAIIAAGDAPPSAGARCSGDAYRAIAKAKGES